MNKKLISVDNIPKPIRGVPLRGYMFNDDGEQLYIQDHYGTWIVKKVDTVAIVDWDGKNPGFKGKPICAFIKEGSEIHELRRYRIERKNHPITLKNPLTLPKVDGHEEMVASQKAWMRHLGFQEGEGGPDQLPGYDGFVTWSCWTPSGGGPTCDEDDCG
jgi:hypothetical protein